MNTSSLSQSHSELELFYSNNYLDQIKQAKREKELLNLSQDLNPITQRLVKYVTNICNIEKQKKALDEELKENLVLLKVDCQSYLDTLE